MLKTGNILKGLEIYLQNKMDYKIIDNKILIGSKSIDFLASVHKFIEFNGVLVILIAAKDKNEYEKTKELYFSNPGGPVYSINLSKGEIIWQWPYKGVANIWKDEDNPEQLVIWNGAACYTSWVNPYTGEAIRQQAEK